MLHKGDLCGALVLLAAVLWLLHFLFADRIHKNRKDS